MTLARHVPILAALLLVAACGYSTTRLTTVDYGGKTIAVKPITNATFRRDLSIRLTEEILRQIRARTSFVITSLDRADYIIEGTQYAEEVVAIQRANRTAVQMQFRGTVSVELKDRRTGRVVKKYSVNAGPEYVPDSGETLEGSATESLNRRLAIRIVQGLEAGF